MSRPIPAMHSTAHAINFQEVLRALHAYYTAQGPGGVNTPIEAGISWSARQAYVIASREAAIQAVAFLYEHLTQFEQWREAAHLLAFALPHCVRGDARINTLIDHAVLTASTLSDPETELKAFYAAHTCELPDKHVLDTKKLPARARYYASTALLREAKVAVEYGTTPGGNTTTISLQAADKCTWVGVDVSSPQTEINQAQSDRLGARAIFARDPATEWHGKADIVGIMDCLEHTVYPDELLKRAEDYLVPGGVVVVTWPNGAWSLHTDNVKNAGAGQHLAVENPGPALAYLEGRGAKILGVEILKGNEVEDNASLCIVYKPTK